MKVQQISTKKDAKLAEKFIFEAVKPEGWAYDPILPIPSLKDKLAWLSWANLLRPEQPAFIIKEDGEIIAGIFGEPVEQWFDKGESEIQDVLVKSDNKKSDVYLKLLKAIVDFYKEKQAKQVHFWALEDDFQKDQLDEWKEIAMESFGFAFKGFRRVSKWSGKEIVKIEKYF